MGCDIVEQRFVKGHDGLWKVATVQVDYTYDDSNGLEIT